MPVERIPLNQGEVLFSPHFFDEAFCTNAFAFLTQNQQGLTHFDWPNLNANVIQWGNINWQQSHIKLFGKSVAQPRLTAWHGDKTYSYSGLTLHPAPWNPLLVHLRNELEKLTNTSFNSVLLNWYRDGQDYMGWHSDDEKELGINPTIASVSFGATRRFVLREKSDHQNKIEFELSNGSVLIMQGALQHHWQHVVPKTAKIKESRINLTFRFITD